MPGKRGKLLGPLALVRFGMLSGVLSYGIFDEQIPLGQQGK